MRHCRGNHHQVAGRHDVAVELEILDRLAHEHDQRRMQAFGLLDAALQAHELLQSCKRHAFGSEHGGLFGENRGEVVGVVQEQNTCPGGEHRSWYAGRRTGASAAVP